MKQPELVYWKGSGEVRSDLLQAIRVVGYDLVVVTDIDEVHRRTPDNYPGIIVVDASAGEAEASQRVIEVSALQKLATVPFIFLSYQATKRSAVLKKTFAKFIPVDIPFKLQDIIQRFLELCPVNASEVQAEPHPSEPAQKTSILVPGTPVETPTKRVEGLVIRQHDPSKLASGHGGEFIALASRLELIDDQLLLPSHPKRDLLARALNAMTTQSEWLGLHARRVSFFASAIANSLGVGSERDRVIRTTGLLLNWGLRESSHLTLSYDILLDPDEKYLQHLVKAYRDSARFVRENVQDDAVARTIEEICQILISETDSLNGGSLIDVQCTVVSELADRSVWSNQKWDPYGTHRAVRKFFRGEPYQFDRSVVIAASRALSEASAIRLLIDPLVGLERVDESDAELVADAEREAERLFEVKNQVSLELADLQPGMTLSRPLISWDGKLLLRANTALSEELIILLWRLSTVRPVRNPVSILAMR